MSFLNQSGDLLPFSEVVPASAQFGAPERSSILTQRKRARVTPQTGANYGTSGTSAAGGGNQQIQFLIADAGGMLDLASVVINYNVQTSTASSATHTMDDGHPFMTVQILCNGQLLENIQQAPKLANVEMTMAGSKTYYQTAGSLQGWALLNNDLVTTVPVNANSASSNITGITAWGFVKGNQPSEAARTSRAAAAVFNQAIGEQKSIPLGMMCGFGRLKQYLPLNLVGEISIVLITGSPQEVCFTTDSVTAGDYALQAVNCTYDIVVPDSRYAAVLQKVAMEDPVGLTMPFESSIVSTGAAIAASATSLSQYDLIVSRATNHLLRCSVVQTPTTASTLIGFPSQSCFGHAGVYSAQFRIGSSVYPQIAAQGDADLFNMSLAAYGSVMQENGSVTNRVLWGNSTNGASAGTAAVFETAEASSGGTVKFAYGDKFVPSYGFQVVKGDAEPLAVDGVSLAGASGSQLIVSLVAAPGVQYTPYVILTALKFLKAQGGSVSVVGA
jgi:hypothetical protein